MNTLTATSPTAAPAYVATTREYANSPFTPCYVEHFTSHDACAARVRERKPNGHCFVSTAYDPTAAACTHPNIDVSDGTSEGEGRPAYGYCPDCGYTSDGLGTETEWYATQDPDWIAAALDDIGTEGIDYTVSAVTLAPAPISGSEHQPDDEDPCGNCGCTPCHCHDGLSWTPHREKAYHQPTAADHTEGED